MIFNYFTLPSVSVLGQESKSMGHEIKYIVTKIYLVVVKHNLESMEVQSDLQMIMRGA